MSESVWQGVVLDMATVDLGDLDRTLVAAILPQMDYRSATRPDEVVAAIGDASVVVSNKVVLSDEVMTVLPKLRLICVAATGYNNVDIDAARRHGIAVSNARGYATPSVVQQVFTFILALNSRLQEHHQAVQQGGWQRSEMFCLLDYPFRELQGLTMGIVGYGELGKAVAAVATAFGMKVLIAQRPGGEAVPGRVPLDELLPQVDVLSLHCPLSEETRGLIGERELQLMKPDALLINTARGGVVDEQALLDALQQKEIGGAGVDVLSQEPPSAGNPLLTSSLPNLVITPHIAWASRQARQRLLDDVALNIQAFMAGETRNRIV